MSRSRTVIVAGAGIGGLAAALALARKGFRVVVLEQAERLEEAGAGLQLSPNATRVLVSLGLGDALRPRIVAPEDLVVRRAAGGEIVRLPLGAAAEARWGAPYWVAHRADLQDVLREAALAHPDIVLQLGTRAVDFAVHAHGVTVAAQHGPERRDQHGIALVGADGLWSLVRNLLGDVAPPIFRHRTAWRATVPADAVSSEWRRPATNLWLGADAHLVHYPLKAGAVVNLVAIVRDDWQGREWSRPGDRDWLMARFARWSAPVRELMALPDRWLKWALADRPALAHWGDGPVTLVGDAAHPMLPFLAQGAAMAIEDAAVLADCLGHNPGAAGAALRHYEHLRAARTARVQGEARRNSAVYHLAGPAAFARDAVLKTMGPERLTRRYDWLYGWKAT